MKFALPILVSIISLFVGWKLGSQSKSVNLLIERDGAVAMRDLFLLKTTEKLRESLPNGPESESSATGTVATYGSKGEFEVLTSDEISWERSVDHSIVQRVANELESLPEIELWVGNGKRLGQNRRIAFKLTGTEERPRMRFLFLCNNLPEGQVDGKVFLKNTWP